MTSPEDMSGRPAHQEIELQSSSFIEAVEKRQDQGLFVCVGLDPVIERLPESVQSSEHTKNQLGDRIFKFNQGIIDATADLACVFKPNSAFYERYGGQGRLALSKTVKYIKDHHPEVPVILDAKRADIDSTNEGYVESSFDELGADAITIHPYLGRKAMKPFLDRKDKGIIVLAKTSNSGADEFQDLSVGEIKEPLYLHVARNVANDWNENGNCALVAGATFPEELAQIRSAVGDMQLLIPGIGHQGGDLDRAVRNGINSHGKGIMINSSRGIIYASSGEDFDDAARAETERMTQDIYRIISET